MKVLFTNTHEPCCGVHQYGVNLATVLRSSNEHEFFYCAPGTLDEFLENYIRLKPDVILYNWQAGAGGWMAQVPLPNMPSKQVLVYHDLEARFADFDAILFSDPTMAPHDNWHPIGRPIHKSNIPIPGPQEEIFTIGVNGFIGAWAVNVMREALSQFSEFKLRLHLPHATYGDQAGNMAAAAEFACRQLLREGVKIEVSHQFMNWFDLITWLNKNHINCYFRDKSMHWRGVSSALDAALMARRPIAINKCDAFRHMLDCQPTICVEDRPIYEIFKDGLSPLVKKYSAWDEENVRDQVIKVLEYLLK